jgi:hypothetical protein
LHPRSSQIDSTLSGLISFWFTTQRSRWRVNAGLNDEIPLGFFPVTLTDDATFKKWECLDSATGEASAFNGFRRDKLAEAVRKPHLPDFPDCQPKPRVAR